MGLHLSVAHLKAGCANRRLLATANGLEREWRADPRLGPGPSQLPSQPPLRSKWRRRNGLGFSLGAASSHPIRTARSPIGRVASDRRSPRPGGRAGRELPGTPCSPRSDRHGRLRPRQRHMDSSLPVGIRRRRAPTAEARYGAGMSNDGVHWTPVPGLTDPFPGPTGRTPRQLIVLAPAAFARFRMNAVPWRRKVLSGTAMDLHVRLDHA